MLRLEQLCRQNGFTRSELARRAKMAPSDVGKIINGRIVPYEGQLRKLARALKYVGDPDDLMKEADFENRQ